MKAHEGMITVPGGKVWYRKVGLHAPGTPLLVLHGGPGATSCYLENLAELAAQRPVIFYDQLGGGRSERPDNPALWTIERFVEELAAVRAALALDHLALLGQSWGALLAVAYLLARGADGVKGLILSGPLLNVPRWVADQRELLRQMPQEISHAVYRAESSGDFDAAGYQAAMDAYYRKHLCRLDPWPDCLRRTFEEMGTAVYQQMWGPSEFTCTGTLAEVNLLPRLNELDLPSLITCGRHDEATPATCETYRSHIRGAEFTILEDASHTHHLEQPKPYLDAVRTFLERVAADC